MPEHPILMSGEMVRAIREGRKTQTRRVIKPQPISIFDTVELATDGNIRLYNKTDPNFFIERKCPYGQPGDRLWVKETWTLAEHVTVGDGINYPKEPGTNKGVMYRATYKNEDFIPKWKSSRFMPHWASRITLEVVNVRVERLQDISDADCEAEGIRPSVDGNGQDWLPDENGWHRAYRQLWNSINAKRYPKSSHSPKKIEKTLIQEEKKKFYSWENNPWVWVIEFKQVAA